ncbi:MULTISPECIES: MFS transporter [Bacteroidales]|jgi:FHS family L-fucose permease-like MFS transporter|uniref:MFS transporter n=1 Tax=Bacteroidales TaxID=171549 RepID=UPI000E80AB0E|nr:MULTISPECIES: MFS transporter [Bacteroidales]MBJ2193930.1 MFS transporter [Muribaculaceae bacterium]ROS82699.1 MFS transporter [Muribaculaceae bacterium Isolate-036 (Harlan)]RXE66762.1 MFS transporter [Muribaculaceae bacterium Isolate-001 (NCI)]HBY16736.1 MFS transporter [Porphyromonadaceae bacterium]MBJ2198548.1 MFS transporter [Muribaculaceae bacterium]
MTQSTQKRSLVAIVTMFFIFAMISFVTNMAAPFGNIWGFKYEWAGMAGNLMNFTAYLFMGIPAGNMLIRYGYKKTALIALAVGAIGLGIQLLSSVVGGNVVVIGGENPTTLNLFIYLLGALVCGFCVCMLNTVVNPMLNLLGGGGNKGNQLVQAGGTLNSLSGTLTPLLVGMLVGTLTKETTMAAVAPLVTTGIVIFVVAFIIISFIRIQEPQANLKQVKYEHSPLAFRHCLLGVIAIFFYVGIEIGIPGELNAWISRENFEGAAAVAGSLAALYWLMMLIGRFLSTIISGKVSTRAQMITVSSVAILLVLIAIFLPEDITFKSPEIAALNIMSGQVPLKCLFLFLCGLCTSVMWGGIFNLATEGLGKYTAKASGLFMMMVVGGGIMPFIQDWIARVLGGGTFGYINSYWLVVAMLAYILYYSVVGSKNINKDIPVGEEPVDLRDL